MAGKEFLLEIVTPESVFYSGNADRVVLRTIEGDICILKNHEPYVAPLGIGKMKVVHNDKDRYAVLSQGYVKVDREKLTILTDTAEWADQIDIERAEAARQRAKKRHEEKQEGIDFLRAEVALKKAIQRIDTAKLK